MLVMYLKCHTRTKDGKQHRYWSIAEKRRGQNGKRFEHHVLYLGEINDQEREAWTQRIAVFDEQTGQTRQLALFPADREIPKHAAQDGVQIRLEEFSLQRPREWGACWVFCRLWQMLELDGFWVPRLSDSRKGTCWLDVLKVLCANRLICPSSEWYVHREWFDHCAISDLLGADPAVSAKDTLYRCLDQLPAHKNALFQHLRGRWVDLFNVSLDVLLYDLTSTYFESEPVFSEKDKRKFGYSRDHRSDCVLRETRRREGRYLLRSNMLSDSPAKLWEFYLQLVEVEETFRTLKGDLEIRPIFHQEMGRVEAHLFVAFLAYCLHVTLKKLLQPHARGLTPRQVLDKFAAIQMLDVHFPTTDGRELIFRRYTKPEPDQQLLLNTLGWELPRQSPPRITAKGTIEK